MRYTLCMATAFGLLVMGGAFLLHGLGVLTNVRGYWDAFDRRERARLARRGTVRSQLLAGRVFVHPGRWARVALTLPLGSALVVLGVLGLTGELRY